jgi:hypothetical protein
MITLFPNNSYIYTALSLFRTKILVFFISWMQFHGTSTSPSPTKSLILAALAGFM